MIKRRNYFLVFKASFGNSKRTSISKVSIATARKQTSDPGNARNELSFESQRQYCWDLTMLRHIFALEPDSVSDTNSYEETGWIDAVLIVKYVFSVMKKNSIRNTNEWKTTVRGRPWHLLLTSPLSRCAPAARYPMMRQNHKRYWLKPDSVNGFCRRSIPYTVAY